MPDAQVIQQTMARKGQAQLLVIGVGNRVRHDDAAGLVVAARLRRLVPPAVTVLEAQHDMFALIEQWQETDMVILVDAVSPCAGPGTVYTFDVVDRCSLPLPEDMFRHSTHGYGLVDAVEMARSLHRLPQRLIVYGIEGVDFDIGEGLSPEVEAVIDDVVASILGFAESTAAEAASQVKVD